MNQLYNYAITFLVIMLATDIPLATFHFLSKLPRIKVKIEIEIGRSG